MWNILYLFWYFRLPLRLLLLFHFLLFLRNHNRAQCTTQKIIINKTDRRRRSFPRIKAFRWPTTTIYYPTAMKCSDSFIPPHSMLFGGIEWMFPFKARTSISDSIIVIGRRIRSQMTTLLTVAPLHCVVAVVEAFSGQDTGHIAADDIVIEWRVMASLFIYVYFITCLVRCQYYGHVDMWTWMCVRVLNEWFCLLSITFISRRTKLLNSFCLHAVNVPRVPFVQLSCRHLPAFFFSFVRHFFRMHSHSIFSSPFTPNELIMLFDCNDECESFD